MCMFSLLEMQKYLRITLSITVCLLSLFIQVLSACSVFAPSIKAVKIHLCSLACSLFQIYVALALTAFCTFNPVEASSMLFSRCMKGACRHS